MVADLCHVVLSCFRGEKAKRRQAKTRQMVNFSCFRERSPGENPPKSPFGVFSRGDLSPRQAKIRQTGAKTRKVATRKPAKWWLFRVFEWRPFAPPHDSTRHSTRCVFGYCLSYLRLARRKVAMQKPDKIPFLRVFAGRPFAFSTWHKSATIFNDKLQLYLHKCQMISIWNCPSETKHLPSSFDHPGRVQTLQANQTAFHLLLCLTPTTFKVGSASVLHDQTCTIMNYCVDCCSYRASLIREKSAVNVAKWNLVHTVWVLGHFRDITTRIIQLHYWRRNKLLRKYYGYLTWQVIIKILSSS